ncbi:hypothetical protein [Halomicrococcus sp. NG-SE-24]|uniref:hypothetical protein n=1 Tax=Halomicrococcus sp. NG-SE-24 TaxID=3436928 RepID=UPI003D96876E
MIEDRLRNTNSRLSVVLLSSLDYPYARHINMARHLEAVHDSELSESDRESLDALLRTLTVLASGREYFTTLYFKRELRDLSSNLLVLSLPVIVFTSYVLLAIDAGLFPQTELPAVEPRLFYVDIAFVVALSPYVLLSSYMLRILTVSKHSLESTVFTLDSDAEPGFDG